MNPSLLHRIVRRIESTVVVSDAELLHRFATGRSVMAAEANEAFAELLHRHGPMVWAACRQLLADSSDAEDAFQATFLALVRSAASVRSGEAIGGWLHGVAVRAALKLRREAARRRAREHRVATREASQPIPDATWDALMTAVHEEVRRLPDALRTAFVLCDLQGVPQSEAATRLGWKPGTLTGRLSRARQRLLERLAGRGLAPAVATGGIIAGSATASVPQLQIENALSLPAGVARPAVLKLVQEIVPMTVSRVKLLAAAVLVTGGIAAGIGPVFFGLAEAQDAPARATNNANGAAPQPGAPAVPAVPAVPTAPPAIGGSGVADPLAPRMEGTVGGLATAGRSHWDYKFVDLNSDDQDSYVKAIRQAGSEGWELCASERLRKGNDPVHLVLTFKRPVVGVVRDIGITRTAPPLFGLGDMPGMGAGMPATVVRASTVRTFTVGNQNPENVAAELMKLLAVPNSQFRVVSIPNSKQIMVYGNEVEIQIVEAFLKREKSDPNLNPPTKPPGFIPSGGSSAPAPSGGSTPAVANNPLGGKGKMDDTSINVFALKHANANELAAVLQKVFPREATITADNRTNSIIVSTNSTTMESVRALIPRLDTPSDAVAAGGAPPAKR